MAKLRSDKLPNSLSRLGNKDEFRMEPEEFLAIWNCSDQEIEQITGGWSLEDLKDFYLAPTEASYRFALYHRFWSRQVFQMVEQSVDPGQIELSVFEPQVPGHELWAEVDEFQAFDMTPREFKFFWDVQDHQLVRILQMDIKQVRSYLNVPASKPVPRSVRFLLGFVHHQWMQESGNESLSMPHALNKCCKAVQNQYSASLVVAS